MIFHVITTFPEFVRSVFDYGVLRRAVQAGLVQANVVDLRDFTDDRHRTTDDASYGGGPGMVMLAEPIFRAVDAIRAEHGQHLPLIYLSPAGELFTQAVARELAGLAEGEPEVSGTGAPAGERSSERSEPLKAGPPRPEESNGGETNQPPGVIATGDGARATKKEGFILLCGRYEGVDQRVIDGLVDRELSIGDYVLSGGELAAMVVIDAVARLLPGVLGNEESAGAESFSAGLLDWPHYTRPEEFRGMRVPEVLLSGHHGKIMGFREEAALLLTYRRRPELLSPEQVERAKQILASGRHEGSDDAVTD